MSDLDEIIELCVECQICWENCEFLSSVCDNPRELAQRLKGNLMESPQIPFLCNLCGLCGELCPEELDIGEACLLLRGQLIREGLAPLPKHRRIVEEQEWLFSNFFLSKSDGIATRRFFFPGCSLSAYSPELVIKTYEYLQSKLKGTGIMLGCCGAPSHDIGDDPLFQRMQSWMAKEMDRVGASELIVACPYCYSVFRESLPEIEIRSLYEIMVEHGIPHAENSNEKTFSLHDSCKTRHEDGFQNSVRNILKELGYGVKEPEFTREMTRCCGMGGSGAFVDFKLVNRTTMRRVKEMPFDILSYCATCRDAFSLVGKPSLHLLDLLFNPEWEEALKSPPQVSRRENQMRLRDMIIEDGT
jgi:Fe-S oxidoreductase